MKIRYTFGPKIGQEAHERNDIAMGLIRSGMAEEVKSAPVPVTTSWELQLFDDVTRGKRPVLTRNRARGKAVFETIHHEFLPEHVPAEVPAQIAKAYKAAYKVWRECGGYEYGAPVRFSGKENANMASDLKHANSVTARTGGAIYAVPQKAE